MSKFTSLSLRGLCFLWICTICPSNAAAKEHRKLTGDRPSVEKDYSRYVELPGAERIGSDQCLSCHAEESKTFRRTVHSQEAVECESCHGPGSLHVKSENNYTKIVKFSAASSDAANGVCLTCHSTTAALQNWSAGSHQGHDVRCVNCHRVHTKEAKLDSRREQNEACIRCHRKQAAEGNLPYHHPIREAKMSCADCHDPHGGTASNNLRADNLNELCFQCHAEFQGPFTYQHVPVSESCLKCHTSHGSMHRNLLQVSEPMLCLQCHPGHHNGSGVPILNRCTNCHSSIHGSDVPSATGGSVFIDKP
jgi:DmsE family decaheme c-type cytochrome